MGEPKLTNDDFTKANEPFALFREWFDDAKEKELNDPNAFALATVDEDGMPNVRMVLLNGLSENAFTFYTNFESAKGREILSARKASICFHWKSLRRQVRVRGDVTPVEDSVADAYYASRPRGSRIGAWASEQSRPLLDRKDLEDRVNHFEQKFDGQDVPRPHHWSGFDIKPRTIEFWHDRPYRLHDRIIFKRDAKEQWQKQRLYP